MFRIATAIVMVCLAIGSPSPAAWAQAEQGDQGSQGNQENQGSQGDPKDQPPPAGSSGAAPKIQVKDISPVQVTRGGWVTLSVTRGDQPVADETVRIYLDGRPGGTATRAPDGSFSWQVPKCEGACSDDAACSTCNQNETPRDAKAWSCRVPVPLGTHDLQVVLGSEARPVTAAEGASQITILSGAKGTPKITGIFPVPSYPDEEMYRLTIQGEGFSPNACDNDIFLAGQRREICWGPDEDCDSRDQMRSQEKPPKPPLIRGQLVSTREMDLYSIPTADQKATSVQIGVGDATSDKVDIRFSRVGRKAPVRVALFGVVVISALLLLTAGKKEKIEGRYYRLASRLFLDRETDTYSLSKLQFYIWTLIGVLGYVYLAVSAWLVQGKLDFVDVPEGLPGIVFISAATSVLAQWAQSARGPKGAGEVHPSFSDFITSGGVVAPERVQFFVWTVLGAFAYISLVFLRDPGTIADLPEVPDGFLQLMGISSAGYLGGKLARKPGPVIDNITAEAGSLILTLYGRNLSADASFFIRPATSPPEEQSAGTESTESAATEQPPVGEEKEITPDHLLDNKPKVVERDDPTGDPTMAKKLKITIKDPLPEWKTGKPELTIVNPDGQRATLGFKPPA